MMTFLSWKKLKQTKKTKKKKKIITLCLWQPCNPTVAFVVKEASAATGLCCLHHTYQSNHKF